MEEINELINDTKENVVKLKEEIESLNNQAMDLGREFQESNTKRDEIENTESAQYKLQDSISNEILEKLRDVNEKSKELKSKAIEKINIAESKCEANKEKLAEKILENKEKKEKKEKEIEQFSELIRRDKEENNIDESDQIMQNRMKKILSLKAEVADIDRDISESMGIMNEIDDKIKFLNYDDIENLVVEKNDKDIEDEKDGKDEIDAKDEKNDKDAKDDKDEKNNKDIKDEQDGKDEKNDKGIKDEQDSKDDKEPEMKQNVLTGTGYQNGRKDIEFASGAQDDKNISIKIIENKEVIEYTDSNGEKAILASTLGEEKRDMYKRLKIGKMCREAIKNTKGKRRLGLMLQRKVNPEIVKALEDTGNTDMIQDYIESIYTKEELPFELTHDLSGLSRMEKWKMRKYTKVEEKCGAKIIGKMWEKNRALPEGEKEIEKIEQEEKEVLAQNVQKIMGKDENVKMNDRDEITKQELERRKARRPVKENETDITKEDKPKGNASFVQKVDGKNKEIAEKYRQESKREMDELLNNLGSEHSDTDKFSMADYINKYGVEAAKERYSKQFASAEVNLSVKEMIDEKHEKELPGNKQIDRQSEGEDR